MRSLLLLTLSLTAVLVLGASGASAWQRDPDTRVDATNAVGSVLKLLAPPATVGDGDTAAVGVGDEPVGIGSSAYPTVSTSSSGTTFWVDNTPLSGDCPQATYPTIQAAVNASGPKDTVKVCPGTYPEQVRIEGHAHDGLRLESLTPLGATIQWPAVETAPLALVHFQAADDVTLRGFTISGPYTFAGCSPERHEGILVENAFNERIDHNHITMIRNSVLALRGCQEGDAVAIGHRFSVVTLCGGTVPGSARLDHNLIDEYQKNGVQVFNEGSSAVVDHNEIVGPANTVQPHAASNGAVVLCEAAASVDHNVIRGNHFTGLFTLATSGGVIIADTPANSSSVDYNRIFDNDYGIETDSQIGLDISHNDVFQHLTDGIVLCGPMFGCDPTEQIVLRSNDVEDNLGSGILLLDADSNLLKTNHVERNGTAAADTTDGIRLDTGSAGNLVLENHMEDNLTHDCHDSNAPANTWRNNTGDTSFPLGLCKAS
jgi:copper-binding protein NosD